MTLPHLPHCACLPDTECAMKQEVQLVYQKCYQNHQWVRQTTNGREDHNLFSNSVFQNHVSPSMVCSLSEENCDVGLLLAKNAEACLCNGSTLVERVESQLCRSGPFHLASLWNFKGRTQHPSLLSLSADLNPPQPQGLWSVP